MLTSEVASTPPQCPILSPHSQYELDLNGVCMEIGQLEGIKAGLHHLLLPRLRLLSPHYVFIKKHVNLRSYSNDGLTALRNAVGHTVAYVDGGYTLIFKALTADAQRPDTRLRQRDLYNVMALALLNEAISNFQDLLRELPPRHKARTTVRKQGTSDTARFHVLARDKEFILSLLDRAVAKANECHFLKVVCFLNQFGQKQTEGLMMGTVVQLTRIKSISLHFACNISAQDPRVTRLKVSK